MLSGPRIMEHLGRLQAALSVGVAEHIYGDALAYVRAGANAVDHLLHLSMTAIARSTALEVAGSRESSRKVSDFSSVGENNLFSVWRRLLKWLTRL